jgi:hypothetical protein
LVLSTLTTARNADGHAVCEEAGYPEWNGTYNTLCFQNLNASNVAYKDLSPGNWINRQWMWMLCNEPYVLISTLIAPTGFSPC